MYDTESEVLVEKQVIGIIRDIYQHHAEYGLNLLDEYLQRRIYEVEVLPLRCCVAQRCWDKLYDCQSHYELWNAILENLAQLN